MEKIECWWESNIECVDAITQQLNTKKAEQFNTLTRIHIIIMDRNALRFDEIQFIALFYYFNTMIAKCLCLCVSCMKDWNR